MEEACFVQEPYCQELLPTSQGSQLGRGCTAAICSLLAPVPGNYLPESVLRSGWEAAFLHGPSGGRGLARAWPHDGFTEYDFLMWGLLRPAADSIPSGVRFLKELREGKTPRAGCPCWGKGNFVCTGLIVYTGGNLHR